MTDLSKYKRVEVITSDTLDRSGLDKVNDMLSRGWEIIDAKIVQWTLRGGDPPGYTQSGQWHFILGITGK